MCEVYCYFSKTIFPANSLLCYAKKDIFSPLARVAKKWKISDTFPETVWKLSVGTLAWEFKEYSKIKDSQYTLII